MSFTAVIDRAIFGIHLFCTRWLGSCSENYPRTTRFEFCFVTMCSSARHEQSKLERRYIDEDAYANPMYDGVIRTENFARARVETLLRRGCTVNCKGGPLLTALGVLGVVDGRTPP